jgi:glycosyltransferase involved in cell wall biosynthesis
LRIGFDARLIGSLGIGRYISGMLPPLADSLKEELVVFSPAAEVALVRALTAGQARIVVSNARPYRGAEQSTFLLSLLGARLALMHFPHYDLPLGYLGRYVVTIHDLFPYRFPDIHSGLVPRLANQLLIRNAAARAAAIITPSQATADDLRHRFPRTATRIRPISEAAAERFTATRNRDAEAAWQRYLGIQPPYFLYLGQWKSYKNLQVMIAAFAQVLAELPELQLVIAGSDPRHPEVPAAAGRLPPGSVALPGHLPDDAVADLYRGSAALILPSIAEGFGLPVVEAMACGVQVVCSDIPALREVADGVAIFCVPSSADSFAAGMREALNGSNRAVRTQRGLERAQQFSWKKAAEETLETYERALAGLASSRSRSD